MILEEWRNAIWPEGKLSDMFRNDLVEYTAHFYLKSVTMYNKI